MPKVWKILGICVLVYGTIMIFLCIIWYKGIFKGSFTFFDDSQEWLQMDKAGHFFASFHVSRWLIQILTWQKVDYKSAVKIGVWGGMIFVTPIEVLDGFSQAYGFSWTDVLANLCGCLFLLIQLSLFNKMRFLPKFSFYLSPFAAIRKEMLGNFLLSNIVKDYNGQTYWLSFSPNMFLKKRLFPEWLLISVGYGVDNVLGGHDNIWQKDQLIFDYSHLQRTRQVYFSFDITLQHLKFENRVMKFVRLAFSCLKMPFPSIVFSQEKGFYISYLGF